ncbi:hypothetical protein [Halosimplex amylolyticum]|uniref:hypothetical protein n=1 Tax=Halosimplex amylolyticum TaxID=3396616 RepID=UPI003F57ED87
MTANFVGGSGGGGGYDYVQSAMPSDPEQGETWLDTDVSAGYVYDGTQWIPETLVAGNALDHTDGTLSVAEGAISLANLSGYPVDAGDVDLGDFLENDGSGNIRVAAGNALADDGNGNLAVQEGNIDHSNLAGMSPGSHHTPGIVTYSQSTEPAGSEGETWLHTDGGTYHVHDGNGWQPIPPVTALEEVEYFDDRSSATVTGSNIISTGSSVNLQEQSLATRPSDDSTFNRGEFNGVEYNPNGTLGGVDMQISANTAVPGDVALRDSNGNDIIRKDASSKGGGDWVHFDHTLQEGTTYQLGVYAESSSVGLHDGGVSYPYSDTYGDITGTVSGASSGDRVFAISQVGSSGAKTSGEVTISLGHPGAIEAWDLVTYEYSADGETVTIDVEDGNGTVLYSDVPKNFDISTVSTSSDVQIQANMSRSNTSNTPQLFYAARRYVK